MKLQLTPAITLAACLLSPVAGAVTDLPPPGGPWAVEISGYDPNADNGGLYQASGGDVGLHPVAIGVGQGLEYAAAANSGVAPVPFVSAYAKGGGDVTSTAMLTMIYEFSLVAASDADASALRSFLLGTPNHFYLDGTGTGRVSGDGIAVSGYASLSRSTDSYSNALAQASMSTNYGSPVYGISLPAHLNDVVFNCSPTDQTGCGADQAFNVAGGLISEGEGSHLFYGAIYLGAGARGEWNASGISGFLSEGHAYIDPLIALSPDFQGDPSHYELTLSPGVANATAIPSVPLPGTLGLFGGALLAALGRGRRR